MPLCSQFERDALLLCKEEDVSFSHLSRRALFFDNFHVFKFYYSQLNFKSEWFNLMREFRILIAQESSHFSTEFIIFDFVFFLKNKSNKINDIDMR